MPAFRTRRPASAKLARKVAAAASTLVLAGSSVPLPLLQELAPKVAWAEPDEPVVPNQEEPVQPEDPNDPPEEPNYVASADDKSEDPNVYLWHMVQNGEDVTWEKVSDKRGLQVVGGNFYYFNDDSSVNPPTQNGEADNSIQVKQTIEGKTYDVRFWVNFNTDTGEGDYTINEGLSPASVVTDSGVEQYLMILAKTDSEPGFSISQYKPENATGNVLETHVVWGASWGPYLMDKDGKLLTNAVEAAAVSASARMTVENGVQLKVASNEQGIVSGGYYTGLSSGNLHLYKLTNAGNGEDGEDFDVEKVATTITLTNESNTIKTFGGKTYLFGDNATLIVSNQNATTTIDGMAFTFHSDETGAVSDGSYLGMKDENQYVYQLTTANSSYDLSPVAAGTYSIGGSYYEVYGNEGLVKNDTYSLNNDGTKVMNGSTPVSYGTYLVNSKYYLVGKNDGTIIKDGVARIDNRTYLSDNEGVVLTGWQTVSSNHSLKDDKGNDYTLPAGNYYFEQSGYNGRRLGELVESGIVVQVDKNGVEQKRFVVGAQSEKVGQRLTGMQKVGGATYYCSPSAVGENNVEQGEMLTGWFYVGGYWMYAAQKASGEKFSNTATEADVTNTYERGRIAMSVTATIPGGSGSKVFDKDGHLGGGWIYADGAWTYAGADGKSTGWLEDPAYGWFYLNPETGHLMTGKVTIAGVDYYLDNDGPHMGWYTPEGSSSQLFLNRKGTAFASDASGWVDLGKQVRDSEESDWHYVSDWYYLNAGTPVFSNMATAEGLSWTVEGSTTRELTVAKTDSTDNAIELNALVGYLGSNTAAKSYDGDTATSHDLTTIKIAAGAGLMSSEGVGANLVTLLIGAQSLKTADLSGMTVTAGTELDVLLSRATSITFGAIAEGATPFTSSDTATYWWKNGAGTKYSSADLAKLPVEQLANGTWTRTTRDVSREGTYSQGSSSASSSQVTTDADGNVTRTTSSTTVDRATGTTSSSTTAATTNTDGSTQTTTNSTTVNARTGETSTTESVATTSTDGSSSSTSMTHTENSVTGATSESTTSENVAADGSKVVSESSSSNDPSTGTRTESSSVTNTDADGNTTSESRSLTETVDPKTGDTSRTEITEKVAADGSSVTENVETKQTTDAETGKPLSVTVESTTTLDSDGNESSVSTTTTQLGDGSKAGDSVLVESSDGTKVQTVLLADAEPLDGVEGDTAEARAAQVQVITTDAEGNEVVETRTQVTIVDPETGEPASGKQVVGGQTYIVAGDDGVAAVGEVQFDGDTYVCNSDGTMKTGWDQAPDGTWRWLADGRGEGETEGAMKCGQWIDDGNGWYLTGESGEMLTGKQEVDGKTYFLSEAHDGHYGEMVTGWVYDDGSWYFAGSDGAAVTGWVFDGKGWYCMDSEGKMMRNTTTPDGERVGADGRWIGK